MIDKLYNKILDNESFLNDLFTSLGATDKVSILKTAGFDLEEEYAKWEESKEMDEDDDSGERTIDDIRADKYEGQIINRNSNG